MNSDCPKNCASRRAAEDCMPRLASPPVNASGSNQRWRQSAAGSGTRGTGANSDLISGRTVGLRIRGDPKRSNEGPPAGGPVLFGGDRAQKWASVIVSPDQYGEGLAIWLEGNGLLVHVEIDVLEGPAAELSFPEAGPQPAILLTSPEPEDGEIVCGLQDP